jgi:hypothetical protein
MDQGTVDILSKDPRKMAQLNAEFIVSHDELTRARKKHSMETIGQVSTSTSCLARVKIIS